MRIAVTAAALRSALGDDPREVWKRLEADETALAPIEGFDASGFGDPKAAQLWTEPEGIEDDPALRILGSHGRILDAAARSAHDQAGLADVARERVGLFVGMGMVDAPVHDLAAAALASRSGGAPMKLDAFFGGAYRDVHPLWPLSMLGNVAAGQVSIDLDIRGDNVVLSSDADASLRAMLEGARSLDRADCDAALVGGVSGRVSPQALARLALQERLGPVELGEGGAVLALARDAGAGALAWITGGASAYGRSLEGPGPDHEAWDRAVRGALEAAGVTAGDVDLVFLHADGHSDSDRTEREALAAAGLDGVRHVRTKEGLGHTGAGAAALDLALATAALQDGAARVLILASGPLGGAAALVVEAA